MKLRKYIPLAQPRANTPEDERGFTLMETSIALVILMVAGLGAASLFAYAVNNNSGAADRQLAMSVAQQTLERLRNVAFTDSSLNATVGTTSTVTHADRTYTVTISVTNSNTVNGSPTMKTIVVTVTPRAAGLSLGGVTLQTQRTTTVNGPYR